MTYTHSLVSGQPGGTTVRFQRLGYSELRSLVMNQVVRQIANFPFPSQDYRNCPEVLMKTLPNRKA